MQPVTAVNPAEGIERASFQGMFGADNCNFGGKVLDVGIVSSVRSTISIMNGSWSIFRWISECSDNG